MGLFRQSKSRAPLALTECFGVPCCPALMVKLQLKVTEALVYQALGGDITLIAKSGVKHHPHGLEDSTPIVEFIERHSLAKP